MSVCVRIDVMRRVSLWAVAGAGYVQGQLFMVKYFVLYGGFSVLARMDHFDAPGPPSCVSCIHRYSEIWKYVQFTDEKLK